MGERVCKANKRINKKNNKKITPKKRSSLKNNSTPSLQTPISNYSSQITDNLKTNIKMDCYPFHDRFCEYEAPLSSFYLNEFTWPVEPVDIEVVERGNETEKHRYTFPSEPISTASLPRCTTAFNEDHFGHFNNQKFREYRKLKKIFNSHDLRRFIYVIDSIYYIHDVSLDKDFDNQYFDYINYERRKKQ